jgi:2-polyprenyl-3-methyl-5-hydroxy-6-metoxy-1,4-benzoquinol methylase
MQVSPVLEESMLLQEVGCIFCNVKHNNVAIRENGYLGQRCESCGLIYISPRPQEKDIEKIYACGDARMAPEQHISRGHLKRRQARHVLKLAKRFVTSGSLLEIGAGAGFFLDEARRAGFQPFAIEPNPTQADFIEHNLGIPCERRALSLDTFQDKQFDVIYHADVISHFYDPVQAFQTMHAKLRHGGFVIFETGNVADLRAKYLDVIPTFQYPDHLFFFGEQALRKLLQMTGFQTLKMYSYSILTELHFAKLLAGQYEPANGARSNGLSRGLSHSVKESVRPAYYNLMHFMRYNVGAWMPKAGRPQTVIVVAQKV